MRSACILRAVLVAALTSASVVHGQVVTAFQNGNLNAFVYDVATRRWATPVPVAPHGFRGLAADNVGRVLYGTTGPVLYRVPFDPPQSPVAVASFTGAVTNVSGGLAWDSLRGELIGTAGSPLLNTLVRIDPATGVTTILRTIGSADLGGLDYDPGSDRLFGTNDSGSTAGGLAGRGLYAISPPWQTGVINRVAEYPEGEIDVDGCAAGGGKIYLIEDEAQWMHIFNLTTGLYESPVFQSSVGVDRASCGGAWAPGLLVAALQADCTVTLADSPDPLSVVGGEVEYLAVVSNLGSSPSGPISVVFQWPAGIHFVSSTPAAALADETASVVLASLPAGASTECRFRIGGFPLGVHTCTVSAFGATDDPDLANNTDAETTTVRPEADLRLTASGPPPCLVWPGQLFYLTGTLTNAGPTGTGSTRIFCSVPNGTTLWYSIPSGTLTDNLLEIPVGPWPMGHSGDVLVAFLAAEGGTFGFDLWADSDTTDPSPENAAAAVFARVRGGCAADYDASGSPDSDDIIAFFRDWDQGDTCADVDGSDSVDSDDIVAFFVQWDGGGC